MYHYAGNNPIKYTDPIGEAIETIWDIGLTIYDIFSAISKSIKGDHSGWGDVALDAASVLIPGVPAGLSKVDDVVKFSKNSDEFASTGKTFFRSMSKTEAEAIMKSGKLRGGRPGETFFTDSKFKSADKAQKRLALPQKPEVQMEFTIKNSPKLERNGSKVTPAFGQQGGGKEYMTTDIVEVEVINVQPY